MSDHLFFYDGIVHTLTVTEIKVHFELHKTINCYIFFLKDVGILEIPAELSAKLRSAAGEILDKQ